MMKLKTVIITGSSTGIGYCAAKMLRDRGYRIFATARKQKDVDRLVSEGFESVQLDLAEPDSIAYAVERILNQTEGALYGLFNNGAYGLPGAVEDLSRNALRTQLETNLLGWLDLTNRIIPAMRSQGYGRIVQNSSVLGQLALPFRGAYTISKFAVEALSDTLRMELADSGIYVSLIEPGPIESRFRQNALAAFQANIEITNSFHRDKYEATIRRLQKEGPAVPFTLPPQAVIKKLIHALEHPRPKPRYFVTFPTYLFVTLRRILSTRMLDRVILRVSQH